MQGTFLQRVILTLFIALIASGLVEFYKNVIQNADFEANKDWRDWHKIVPAVSAHP